MIKSNNDSGEESFSVDAPVEFTEEVLKLDDAFSRLGIRVHISAYAAKIWDLLRRSGATSNEKFRPLILSTFFQVTQVLRGPLDALADKEKQ